MYWNVLKRNGHVFLFLKITARTSLSFFFFYVSLGNYLSLSDCGNDSMLFVCISFQSLPEWLNHVWTGGRSELHLQEDQRWHNLLLRSVLGDGGTDITRRQRLSNLHCTLPHLLPLRTAFLLSPALRCTITPPRLLPKPIRLFMHFAPSSYFLLLARCPASGGGQVQGPLPGPRHGRPRGPEQGDALPVAPMGVRLRAGGVGGPGAASVLREAVAGPRLLHRGLHFHPDTRPHCSRRETTCRSGPEGDGAHLRQLGGRHSGAHGDRWVRGILLGLPLSWICGSHL